MHHQRKIARLGEYLIYSGKSKEQLLAIMREGIEERGDKDRLLLSVSGIPDACQYAANYGGAPIVIMVLNTNEKNHLLPG